MYLQSAVWSFPLPRLANDRRGRGAAAWRICWRSQKATARWQIPPALHRNVGPSVSPLCALHIVLCTMDAPNLLKARGQRRVAGVSFASPGHAQRPCAVTRSQVKSGGDGRLTMPILHAKAYIISCKTSACSDVVARQVLMRMPSTSPKRLQ